MIERLRQTPDAKSYDILEYDVPVDAEAPLAGKVATFADLQGG